MKKKKRSPSPNDGFMKGVIDGCVAFIYLVIVLCTSSVLTVLLLLAWGESQRQEQREMYCQTWISEPVSYASERYICENDLLVEYIDVSICSNNIVDLPHSDVMNLYQDSIIVDEFTYDEVHDLFGEFETDCTSVEARENLNGYDCTYNFIDMYPFIRVFYDNDDRVTDVRTLGCPNLNR